VRKKYRKGGGGVGKAREKKGEKLTRRRPRKKKIQILEKPGARGHFIKILPEKGGES